MHADCAPLAFRVRLDSLSSSKASAIMLFPARTASMGASAARQKDSRTIAIFIVGSGRKEYKLPARSTTLLVAHWSTTSDKVNSIALHDVNISPSLCHRVHSTPPFPWAVQTQQTP